MSTQTPPQTRSRRPRFSDRGKRRFALLVLGAGALFAIGYFIAVYVLFPPPAVPEDGIVVPDLSGHTVNSARIVLEPLGLTVGDTLSLPHDAKDEGTIVAQSPLPGQQVRAGSPVRIGLSAGRPAVTVPDVVGLGARRAATLLARLGFAVQETFEAADEPNGTVLRTSPLAGTRRSLPLTVLLMISSGPLDSLMVDTTRVDTIPTTTTRQ